MIALLIAGCLTSAAPCRAAPGDDESRAVEKSASEPAYRTESLQGRVVWLAEALKKKYGIETDRDALHASVALETRDGRLLPIVKDFRGRGFFIDPRLREMDLELLVRTFEGSPVIQVVRVYALKPDGKYELDYWCDICSIPMYELKECECCQGPIRIRLRLSEEAGDHGPKPSEGGD
ncbi:MAG TPA: hypothetical protein VHC19_26555 [Pirellulales bacterium]|nr:hypothetical protein [Pirellulales bacterium]